MVLSNLKPGQSCYSILVYKNINKYFEYIIHFFIYLRYISGTSWSLNTGEFLILVKKYAKENHVRTDRNFALKTDSGSWIPSFLNFTQTPYFQRYRGTKNSLGGQMELPPSQILS